MTVAPIANEAIATVVRFHDIRRLVELDRALFSLLKQTWCPVRAIIVLQNLPDHLTTIIELAKRLDWTAHGHHAPTVVNLSSAKEDARSELLNLGIAHAQERYFAILDCDDYLYPYAYEYLISGIRDRNAVIAFGNIAIKNKRVIDSFVYATSMNRSPLDGKSYSDLLFDNFAPIHSFVVDRSKISARDFRFNESLIRLEDYDFLLRICSKYPANFSTLSRYVGVYSHDIAGDNSVMVHATPPSPANQTAWYQARRQIWRLKCSIRAAARQIRAKEESCFVSGI